MKKRLFVDMDGTLAVFTVCQQIEILYEKGYFLNREPIHSVLAAVKQVEAGAPDIEVNILSAYLTDSHFAKVEKNIWLDRYLPEIPPERRVLVPFGSDKNRAIEGGLQSGDYLLDDYTVNLQKWDNGKGIKLLNGINHTRGTWTGNSITHKKPAAIIARDIVKIVGYGETVRDAPPQKQRSIAR